MDIESEGSEVTLTMEALDKGVREYYISDPSMVPLMKK